MPKTSRRARCEAVADALELPRPFDLDALCDRIAERRGRPLRLIALEGVPDGSTPCGVWVATGTADLIFYEPATSAFHKLQIVLHELSHMLLGHGSSDAERPAYVARLMAESDTAPVEDAEEDLDMDQLLHILGRTSYTDDEERDAELLATILSDRAVSTPAPATSHEAAGVLDRLNDAFGLPRRW
ncbi:hypothetical protein [Streptomyces chumphonensis]|uniref:hypothetical protein n=1 Tax=Streptomyces chumphonensis TaxID=1214925 RepID=UPI003D702C63